MNDKAGSCDLDDAEIIDAEPEVIELSAAHIVKDYTV